MLKYDLCPASVANHFLFVLQKHAPLAYYSIVATCVKIKETELYSANVIRDWRTLNVVLSKRLHKINFAAPSWQHRERTDRVDQKVTLLWYLSFLSCCSRPLIFASCRVIFIRWRRSFSVFFCIWRVILVTIVGLANDAFYTVSYRVEERCFTDSLCVRRRETLGFQNNRENVFD